MSNLIRIVAAVVDTRNLTLYKDDGSTIVIPQGDPRLRRIVDAVTPQLVERDHAYVAIDQPEDNSYAQFEEKSGGVVKFFRVAKERLKNLFTPKPVEVVPEQALGHIPTTKESIEAVMAAKMPSKVEQTQSVVAEIMQHAVPVSSPDFHEVTVGKQGNVVEANGETPNDRNDEVHAAAPDTIIAVVGDTIIPGMERIKTQFARASKLGSTQGVEAFLQRLASVIDKRSHSVEDLLKFLERADLPIADDGTILIYKVLRTYGKDTYVDCHTQKVEQWVGAYVCMDEKLVDHNRNNECSNGLHVARRGYIRGFNGDVCVLAKLTPEDVIAVPTYDANKMRVCGYHIIAELTKEQYNLLNRNEPITKLEDGKQLLAKALSGQHIGKTHEVRITAQHGGGVQVKKLGTMKLEVKATLVAPVQAEAIGNAEAETLDQPTDPKEVVAEVEQQEEKVQLSRKEQAQAMYAKWQASGHRDDLDALVIFKKTAKVGWDRLGIPDPTTKPGTKTKPPKPFPKPTVAKPVKPTPQVMEVELDGSEDTRADVLNDARDDAPVMASTKRVVNGVELGEGGPKERIQKMLAIGITSVGVAQAILTIKQKAKKSWTVLGVTEEQVAQILKLVEAK
jgi:hypothetical protein